MARKKPKTSKGDGGSTRKRGRPRLEFTGAQEEQIAELAFNGCHIKTIAQLMEVDDKTILAHFSTLIQKKRAEGRTALRRKQMQLALAGDNTMLIWLGKQRLDQSDKKQIEQTHTLKLFDKAAPTEEV